MSQKNNPLEIYVCQLFDKLGYKTRPSKGSGAFGERGDISGQDLFTVECKQRTTENITIKRDVWYKLLNEIPYHSKTRPLYVLENAHKDRFAVMNLDDFFNLIKNYLDKERRVKWEDGTTI